MDASVINLAQLTVAESARRIDAGDVSSEALVTACLDRIAEREDQVQAWAYIDRDYALEQARRADQVRATGRTVGPLHGVPVGIKDIIDTEDMPTENGSRVFAGRRPRDDAAVVTALRDAGAVILGKTQTTEFASAWPANTRNPLALEHTPGGSSSGSGAAVADGMVPAALGTQTAGSVLRPAAYCGVVGFKPTFGLVSRHGVLPQAPSLDTVGTLARTVEDAALLCDCITAYDARDRDMRPRSRPRLRDTATSEPPLPPLFAFVKTPVWDQAETTTQEAFAELADALGEQCDTVDLPSVFDGAFDWQRNVHLAEMAKVYGPLVDKAPDLLSDRLKGMVGEGRKVLATDYQVAREFQHILNGGLEAIFARYDAILTPAATGPAPRDLTVTGSPIFCALWTYLGVPAISLPLLNVEGLPLGVQLVAARGDDARLLRAARWLSDHVQNLT